MYVHSMIYNFIMNVPCKGPEVEYSEFVIAIPYSRVFSQTYIFSRIANESEFREKYFRD